MAAIGCVIAWYPTLASGFAAMQFDPGDSRFNHYVLEHGYRWLAGFPGHESFWDAGFYHPERNVLAYSDTLLGAAPPYWLLRAVGIGEGLAFQLWQIGLGLLNFAVCHWWLRKRFGLGQLAAALGAFLFAFAGLRNAHISHVQLHPHWFAIGAIEAAWRLLEGRGGKWAFGAAACVVAQLYAGFYLGWFLAISFVFAAFAALLLAGTRRRWMRLGADGLRQLRESWPACATTLVLAGLALAPLAAHYLEAADAVGQRTYGALDPPTLASWIDAGPLSVEGAWVGAIPFLRAVPGGVELELGIGLVTTACVLIGLWLGLRDRRIPALLIVTGVLWVVLTTIFPLRVHFWRTMFGVLPGAGAIRALGRVGLAILPLGAVGLGVCADRLVRWAATSPRRAVLVVLVAVAIPFEQLRHAPSFDRETVEAPVRELAREIRRRDCRVFFYSGGGRDVPAYQIHLDAMWAGMLAGGVPTLNGYSGNAPPGWWMNDPTARPLVLDWAARNGVELEDDWLIE